MSPGIDLKHICFILSNPNQSLVRRNVQHVPSIRFCVFEVMNLVFPSYCLTSWSLPGFRRRSRGSRRSRRGCRCRRGRSFPVSSRLTQPHPDRILTRSQRPDNFPPDFKAVNFPERLELTFPSSGHNFPFRVKRRLSLAPRRRNQTNEIMQKSGKFVNNKNKLLLLQYRILNEF